MGKVISINISQVKGVEKNSIDQVEVIEGWGLEGDSHAGDWDRQVSIFPVEFLKNMPLEKKDELLNCGYTENFTISGVEPSLLSVGNFASIGEAVIKILHIGKDQYKDYGRPYIISRQGLFGRVVKGGRVRTGDDITVYPFSEETFLRCVGEGNSTMAKVFLDGGMCPDAGDIYGATALMLAARGGFSPVVLTLLKRGANVNARSDDGITALMAAAYLGHARTVEILLEAGANPAFQSESGLSALSLARQQNNEYIARILLKTKDIGNNN